jgi:dephospho-CoA kinase
MSSRNSQQQDNRLVIGITGRIGAGKTSVGKYLESQHGFYYIRYSQVLSEWQTKDPESKVHLQSVGWEVMAGGMQQELNDRLIARIASQQRCAVDGLRHLVDYENLSRTFASSFYLLYVNSTLELRWQRLSGRYAKFERFRAADSHPVEQYIDSLQDKAFAIVNNESSLEELYAKVDAVLNRIKSGGRS